MPSSNRQIFYDPEQRRWRWVRRLGLVALGALSLSFLVAMAMVLVNPALPAIGLPPNERLPQPHHVVLPRPERPARAAERRYLETRRALAEANATARRSASRPVPAPAHRTELTGFFVNWDDTSFTSLKENIRSLDRLMPEWLHLTDATGTIDLDQPARQQDVMAFVARAKPGLRIVPLVNNFDAATVQWQSGALATMLASPEARHRAIDQLRSYVQARHFAGVNLDFESVPSRSRSHLVQFTRELHAVFHPLGLEVSQSVPLDDPAFDYPQLSRACDYLILMAYDEHTGDGDAGSIASQAWFSQTLERRVEEVTPDRIVVALGSYGYDWIDGRHGTEVSFQEAVRTAAESEGHIGLDEDSLNPTYDYFDDGDRLHHVWFLNGVTAFNEVRDASDIDLRGYALWRLGSEDPSVWTVFDHRSHLDEPIARQLSTLRYGYDIDYEGQGEVLRVIATPREGRRDVQYDSTSGLITDERLLDYPSPYVIERRGTGTPKAMALTFDDGPDPRWTPQILDVLRTQQAPATFFVIGVNADQDPALLERMMREGHEVGNHTFTHPDISTITRQQLRLEINATERLLESVIGRRSLLFRPPYAEDIEPETPDQVNPLLYTSSTGYYTIGLGIDPNDWTNPGVDRIVQDTIDGADAGRGHVVLLHDGGGDRTQTVAALPGIIDGLRRRGYSLVTVSSLVGLSREAVMPPVPPQEWWSLWLTDAAFLTLGSASAVLRTLFLVGIALAIVRLAVIGTLAVWQRARAHRHRPPGAPPATVAVIVPAHNESKVIVRTVEALLASDGPGVDILVVDDGSTDDTADMAEEAFRTVPRVRVLRKPNGGKAAALNYGLRLTDAPIVVALDADTIFEPSTVTRLVQAFRSPRVGAVAGNAKVGNRINLLTRWQALEYITSQNLERRAFDSLNGITVVPGAVGAWRRELVVAAGGLNDDTLAEDADLTMRILRAGYEIVYEDEAIAWTEAPDTVQGLLNQRFRWVFGTLQAAWKQRDTLFRPRFGALGLAAMPNLIVFQVLFPLVSPMMDLQMLASLGAAALQRHQHPAEFSADIMNRTLFFYALFVVVDLAAGALAFVLERKEDWKLLLWLPLQRFTYRQLMYYVVVKSAVAALRGTRVGWGKLERKATVT